MAERTQIPGSAACGEWETLLTDALDGLLGPEDAARFEAHKAVCPACAALYEEARKGREWLQFLAPEPEPPAGLLEKILARTGPGHEAAGWTGKVVPVAAGAAEVPAFVPPVWQQPGFYARMRQAVRPQLLMTAAMAFFSIALTLNLTGVRLANLKTMDLRPRAVRSYMERQFATASVPIVRYYDHLRLAYELESRVRELRGRNGDENGGQQDKRNNEPPAAPGETRQNPGQLPDGSGGGSRVDPPLQSGNPAGTRAGEITDDYFEAASRPWDESAQYGCLATQARERSTPWIV